MKADRKRAEEFIRENYGEKWLTTVDWQPDDVIDAMIEFASFPVVTDEEIMEMASDFGRLPISFPQPELGYRMDGKLYEGFIAGFKACLSRSNLSEKPNS